MSYETEWNALYRRHDGVFVEDDELNAECAKKTLYAIARGNPFNMGTGGPWRRRDGDGKVQTLVFTSKEKARRFARGWVNLVADASWAAVVKVCSADVYNVKTESISGEKTYKTDWEWA